MKQTTITREHFFDMVGEWPEDVLGADWKNEVDEFMEGLECPDWEGCDWSRVI